MARLMARRLVVIPLVLILIHFLGFAYAHVARPLRAARNPSLAGLIEPSPLLPAYSDYVQGVFHLDFGQVPGSNAPIVEVVAQAGLASLGLLGVAAFASCTGGITAGLMATHRAPPRTANWLTALSTGGLAMPTFYLGTLLILAMLYVTISGVSGTSTPLPTRGFGWDAHLVLPVLTLMLRPMVQVAQVTSALLVQELRKDYVMAARGFGYRWRHILRRLAMRNVWAQIVLTINNTLRFLVGELIVVEFLFAWPGIGKLMANTLVPSQISTQASSPMFLNPPVVAALLTVLATLFLSADFVSAIVIRSVDPRLGDLQVEVSRA
jgi:ABC-type dipeptide/oligopeptide/nickel transport system permease component